MPTYSYACTECDNKFDQVQAFTDDALTECPQCSGRLRKLFGKAADPPQIYPRWLHVILPNVESNDEEAIDLLVP